MDPQAVSTIEPDPRPSWEERIRAVQREFPVTGERWWGEHLRDVELVGRVLGDLIRVGHTPKRRGQRPSLDAEEGEVRLRQLTGDDYSTLSFAEAFRLLRDGRRPPPSLTRMHRGTGLARPKLHRLLAGLNLPTAPEMEAVAAYFGKPPIYFAEYRRLLILAAVDDHLRRAPDASMAVVRQLGALPPR